MQAKLPSAACSQLLASSSTLGFEPITILNRREVEENRKDKNVQLSERSYGVFVRVLQLPPGIDPSSVQATMSNGILKLTIPKPAQSEPKKIEVKDAA